MGFAVDRNHLKNGLVDIDNFDFDGLPKSADQKIQYLLDGQNEERSSRPLNADGYDVSAECAYICINLTIIIDDACWSPWALIFGHVHPRKG